VGFVETLLAAAVVPPALWLLQGGSPLQSPFVPIILMVVIFYFVLFMPMRRKQRKLDEMLRNLKNGDKVVTSGGIIGTLVAVGDDNTVTVRVKPDNVKLEISRNAVTALVVDQEEKKS
jgi:preprotein translocase subunit YajC